MDTASVKNPAERRSVDPVWTTIREAAQAAASNEPVLAGMLHATILSQSRFEGALSYHLARLAGTTEVPAALIRQIFDEAFTADPNIGLAARFDIGKDGFHGFTDLTVVILAGLGVSALFQMARHGHLSPFAGVLNIGMNLVQPMASGKSGTWAGRISRTGGRSGHRR